MEYVFHISSFFIANRNRIVAQQFFLVQRNAIFLAFGLFLVRSTFIEEIQEIIQGSRETPREHTSPK